MSFVQVSLMWADNRPTQNFIFNSMDVASETVEAMLLKMHIVSSDDIAAMQADMAALNDDDVVSLDILGLKVRVRLIATTEDMVPPEPEPDADPVFAYVLMRTDVPDYYGPKAQAQSHHAGTKMVYEGLRKNDAALTAMLDEWEKEAGGFGTCIVLHATAAEMRQAVSLAELLGVHAGIVHDPTFPVKDGDRYTTLPIDTCAFVFGRKSECRPVVGQFNLLRDK